MIDRNPLEQLIGIAGMRSNCGNDGHPPLNQISRQCWQAVIVTLCPAGFDSDVLALDIASFSQARVKRGDLGAPVSGRGPAEKSDHRHPSAALAVDELNPIDGQLSSSTPRPWCGCSNGTVLY
jgi:hypothetical protein